MVYKNEVEGGTAYTAFEPHQIRHAITQGPQVDLRGLRVRPAETPAPKKASDVPNLEGLRVRPIQQTGHKEWFKFLDSSGKSWHVHPEDWPEIQKRDPGAKRLN
jgi:hypothetical protein